MAASEADVAAQLIERLLADQQFRAAFRRDPAQACRDAGLDDLAQEMSLGAGKAMMTLDVRESKSSLAGVMMAAAMEGVGLYEFSKNVLPHLDDVPSAVGDVLSRVNLPSVGGALAASPEPSAAAPAEAQDDEAAAGSSAAAAAAAPAPVAPPEEAGSKAGGEDGGAGSKAGAASKAADKPVVPPEQAAAQKIAAAESPEAKREKEAADAVAKIAEESEDLPDANDFPEGPVAPQSAEEVGPGGKPAPETPAAEEAAPHAHAHVHAPSAPVVPPEAAAPTTPSAPADPAPAAPDLSPAAGGDPAKALLEHPNLDLPPGAQQDLRDGVVDPRMVAVLGQLAQDHKIGLSVIKTGHDQFTSGGSVSNHFVGRGIDIATVDGEPVNPGNAAARELATAIAELDGDLRPTEVGTPWSIAADGFFTDGAHLDHLHVAFDGEPPPGFEAPSAPQPAAADQPAPAPGSAQPAAPPAPERKPGDSIVFAAVTAEEAAAKDAAAAAASGGAGRKPGDSLAFIPAVEAPAAPAAPAPDEAAAAGAAAAGTVTGPGEYPGDDAPREQLAAWMAAEAQKRGLPPELPVMAALVESNLQNLNYGHADSVGFFQMRLQFWNQGEYAGYPDDPEKQIDWFLDQAEQVKKDRQAAGLPIDDPDQYGEWVADVEDCAAEYRYRYQTKLAEAEGLLEDARQAPAPPPTEPAPTAPTEPAPPPTSSKPIDPEQFGAEGTGTGGEPDAEAQALLKNDKVILDEVGVADLKAGRIDPRIVAVLTKLSQEHEITVSCMCSDHSKFTAGGSISNHHFGRGLDIAAVDGVPVNASNFDAREIAMELQEFDEEIRPNEIGTPWAISGDGYFTDAGHQDHLHIGFKEAITPDWTPPAELAQAAAQTPVAPGAAAPVQPGVSPAPPERKAGDSLVLAAVAGQKEAAEEAAAAAAGGGTGAKAGDSLAFMRAVGSAPQPAGPASALAAHAPAPDAVADATAATAAGGSRLGASALEVAKGELGVREEGTNTGVDVDKYLEAASVPPGSPWCASFVTWALAESGRKMEGGGWAAVQTWVRNAEQGNYDLEIVSAEDARPGDLVAYDWGGQDDFGADGHIGFLASNVEGGSFTALEGNWQDAVLKVPRQLGSDGTNMKFIRIKGDEAPSPAPAGGEAAGGAPPTPPTTAPPADPGAAATVLPPEADTAAAGEQQAAAAGDAAEPRRHDSLVFAAVKPQAQEAARVRATLQFMKAIDPAQAKVAASTPVVPPELSTAPEPMGPTPDLSDIGDYPGDEASQAELAKWLAKEAEKAGLPPELPVMAALVESGVKNLHFGHADSVGFFQMRVGIWNKGEYAGYPERPELQAKWFIDTALAVKKQRIAAGDVDFGKDPSAWGEWIADVERPAEEYRGRYQLRLSEARKLLG